MSDNGNKIFASEMFRWITPIFLLVLSGLGSITVNKLNDIDDKLFKHLTNDELHSPRSVTTNKVEFALYREMVDGQYRQIIGEICEIKNYLMTGEKKIIKEKYYK